MSLSEIVSRPEVQIGAAVFLPHVGSSIIHFGYSGGDKWCKSLKKPAYYPPNYVFGPVWAVLYSGMGYASYIVFREGGGFQGPARFPLMLYGANLTLSWSTPILTHYKKMKLVNSI